MMKTLKNITLLFALGSISLVQQPQHCSATETHTSEEISDQEHESQEEPSKSSVLRPILHGVLGGFISLTALWLGIAGYKKFALGDTLGQALNPAFGYEKRLEYRYKEVLKILDKDISDEDRKRELKQIVGNNSKWVCRVLGPANRLVKNEINALTNLRLLLEENGLSGLSKDKSNDFNEFKRLKESNKGIFSEYVKKVSKAKELKKSNENQEKAKFLLTDLIENRNDHRGELKKFQDEIIPQYSKGNA